VNNLCARLLVPVDASEASLEVARFAIRMARQYGSALAFVYVVDVSVRDLLARVARRSPDEVLREMEETGRRTLSHLAHLAEQEGVRAEKVLRTGAMHAQVLTEAEGWGATMIIVGKPQERELRGLFLSRVVRQIIAGARVPVLVVGPPEAEHREE